MSLKELSSGKHPPEGCKPQRLPRLKTPVGMGNRGKDNMIFDPEEGIGAAGAGAGGSEGSRGQEEETRRLFH